MGATTERDLVSYHEVLSRVVRRDLESYRGRRLAVQTYNHATTIYPDAIDFFLRLYGCRGWVWVDAHGSEAAPRPFLTSGARVASELLFHGPLAYLRHRRAVKRLEQVADDVVALSGTDRGLYIRSDHVFGVEAGGSVGHIAGVVDGLRKEGVDLQVLSTDVLRQVPEDARFHLERPIYDPIRNIPELPRLVHNTPLQDRADRHWQEWAPGFLYNRYSMHGYVGPALRARYGVPFVCEYNGSFVWMNRHWGPRPMYFEGLGERIELLNLRAADLVVVVSRAMKKEVVERGIDARKVLVNPNAVDPERYHPDIDGSGVRERYGLEDRLVVGFIGTFGAWHGAEKLAEAAARLFPGGEPVGQDVETLHFLLIGDGSRMVEVRRIIAQHGLEGRVTLTGRVPQEQGPAHLAACDLLASPHIPNPDGTPFFGSPTKLFEYLAMGRAIVASDLDQIGELLEHDETALLVEPGNPEALAGAIRTLARDPERRARLGRRAREVAERDHTWQEHSRRILERLGEVVERGEPEPRRGRLP